MTWRRTARRLAALAALLACVHSRRVGEDEPGQGPPPPRHEGKGRVQPAPGHPAVADSPQGLMSPGSTRRIQEALRSRGLVSEISGVLDDATSAALRKFQHGQDLAETGLPDRETLRRLGLDPNEIYRTLPDGAAQGERSAR